MKYFCHMEIKKSSRADLERGWGLRFVIGLIVVLVAGYVAFNWKTYEDEPVELPLPEPLMLPSEEPLPPVAFPEPQAEALPSVPSPDARLTDADRVETVSNDSSARVLDDMKAVLRHAVAVPHATDDEWTETAVADLVPRPAQPDTLPSFPGGDAACMRFLTRHVRYPSSARARRLSGCVRVQFVVAADGRLTDIRVLRGVSPVLDNEALRVVGLMPRWKPGRSGGRPSRFLYVLPVDFRLR